VYNPSADYASRQYYPAKQLYDQGIVQPTGTAGEIDESERVSPLRSFRIEQTGEASSPVVKKFAMPERLPYDVSTGSFSIVAEDAELADLMDRMIEERAQPGSGDQSSSAGNPQQGLSGAPNQMIPGAVSGNSGSMMTLSVPGNSISDAVKSADAVAKEYWIKYGKTRPEDGRLVWLYPSHRY